MAKAIGREYKIGIGREAGGARGAPADPQFWIPCNSFDIQDRAITVRDEAGWGVMESPVDVQVARKEAGGSFGGRVRVKSIGLLLLNLLGAVSTSDDDPESGVYTHTFTYQESNLHPTITIAVDDPIEGDRAYPLGVLKSLAVRAELDEAVVFEAEAETNPGESVSLTPAYSKEKDFVASDVRLYIASTASGLDSGDEVKVRSVAITMGPKEAMRDNILGIKKSDDILNLGFTATIEITKVHQDTTFRDYFLAGTGRALRVKMEDADATIGNNSHPKLQFDFNQVKMEGPTGWKKNAPDLDGLVTETLTLVANFKIADSKMLQAVLVNTQADYDAEIGGSQLGAKAKIATS